MKNKAYINIPLILTLIVAAVFLSACVGQDSHEKTSAYLFAYFAGNDPGEEAIRYAVSTDGYHYRALNDNEPVLDNKKISGTGGVRDPHLLRGEDGKTFYMVATDLYVPEMGWKNYAMVLMKSIDLIHWTSSIVNIPEAFPKSFSEVYRVWAPVSYTHLRAHETDSYLVCRLLLEK